MAKVEANGIRLEYETFGSPNSPALLLIIGLSGQLIAWDEQLCEWLAQQGRYVIRYDNRDAGLSTKLEQAGMPDTEAAIAARIKGETIIPPYTIEDMAADAIGLLDALGIDRAHICGMSMGGMIAQSMALNFPERVLSLISIYSRTGDPEEPPAKPEAMDFLLAQPPEPREAYIEFRMNLLSSIAGSKFPYDQQWLRQFVTQSYDRCFCPQGVARQLMAIIAQQNRKPALGALAAPTLVVHGAEDPLVPVECGRHTAAAISGADLMIIEGMGHDLPHGGAWPRIMDAVIDHTQKAVA